MSVADTPEMLEAARAGDNGACEQLIEENGGLIWSIVRRYYGRGVDPEDLYQLGCLGFLKAVRGFDPAFGCQFSTYAVPKIAGEIRRFLRDDGAVKVSRGLKERAGTIRTARDKLSAALGREPTLSELAEETGLECEEIAAAEEAVHRLPPCKWRQETVLRWRAFWGRREWKRGVSGSGFRSAPQSRPCLSGNGRSSRCGTFGT